MLVEWVWVCGAVVAPVGGCVAAVVVGVVMVHCGGGWWWRWLWDQRHFFQEHCHPRDQTLVNAANVVCDGLSGVPGVS